ncbi:MAG: ABC transporter ATP-binding protein [Acidobacteria bacterium]|nr:ABC transporter ATP-binding protein [Acidobacteriota bacterium]MDW7983224.1 ABC transporter ATP-binding protein [Acidobacteriota bacterium]
MSWIRVVGLWKSYRHRTGLIEVLRGVDWTVPTPGMAVAIMGPSGAGKTTFLHLMAGLETPDAGEVWIDGRPIHAMTPSELLRFRNERMGFVYQHHFLVEELTALENVILRCRIAGLSASEAYARARRWLAAVGLADRQHHYPVELSGGEAQRVAIARALVMEPALILADEPTGNLDEKTADEVFDLMFQLVRQHRATLVVATHNRHLARRCDVVYRIHLGQIHAMPVSEVVDEIDP